MAKVLNDSSLVKMDVNSVDYNVFEYFASGFSRVLYPMAAIFGGIIGQDVVKECPGNFHLLFQFFYVDSLNLFLYNPLGQSTHCSFELSSFLFSFFFPSLEIYILKKCTRHLPSF